MATRRGQPIRVIVRIGTVLTQRVAGNIDRERQTAIRLVYTAQLPAFYYPSHQALFRPGRGNEPCGIDEEVLRDVEIRQTAARFGGPPWRARTERVDRKSTRLNSSHLGI